MADWVHCNLCGRQLSGDTKFYLGTCSHIFCDRCMTKGTRPCCAICHNPCQVKELNDELDQHLRGYFMVPEVQIKKQVEVMKFQAHHRSLLVKQMRKKFESHEKFIKQAEHHFQKLSEENNGLRKKLQSVEEVNRQLRQDNSLLKKYIHNYKAHESGSLIQKPVTPRQLLHSPNIASPLVHYYNGQQQSPLLCSSRGNFKTAVSPSTPKSSSHRQSGTPSRLMEIQNTPSMNRMSVRQPPSKGKMGTPTQQTPKSGFASQISSPVVGIDMSPGASIRVRSNSVSRSSVTNGPYELMSQKFSNHFRASTLVEASLHGRLEGTSYQSTNEDCYQRLMQKKSFTPHTSSGISAHSKTESVSSKYFAKVIPTPPCTPLSRLRHSPH